ncbi:hypothetical protein AB1Y20_014190 [Prymnesium parvum]|uniref:Uncharacterized protein n=1 Tax=Prymnesium parvum TaxID=97485 RepID=A0AB34ID02_PRYPA
MTERADELGRRARGGRQRDDADACVGEVDAEAKAEARAAAAPRRRRGIRGGARGLRRAELGDPLGRELIVRRNPAVY